MTIKFIVLLEICTTVQMLNFNGNLMPQDVSSIDLVIYVIGNCIYLIFEFLWKIVWNIFNNEYIYKRAGAARIWIMWRYEKINENWYGIKKLSVGCWLDLDADPLVESVLMQHQRAELLCMMFAIATESYKSIITVNIYSNLRVCNKFFVV